MARLSRPALGPAQQIRGDTHLFVRFSWEELCCIDLCDDGRPLCPSLPAEGAVYRLRLSIPDGDSVQTGWYIGETSNLHRRMGNYRNPSKERGHATNRKIHEAIVNTKLFGGTVTLDRVVEADGGEGRGGRLDLDREVCRHFVEAAAVLAAAYAQEIQLLNADEAKRWAQRVSLLTQHEEDGWQ